MITSFFFFKNIKKKLNLFFLIFFSCTTFYSRQNYAFLILIIFFFIFSFKDKFTIKNACVITYFMTFLLPSLYFFYKWGGVINKVEINNSITTRPLNFNLFNVPIILSIYFLYYIPLIIVNIKYYFNKFISIPKLIFFIISFLFFLQIFKQNPEILFAQKLGNGLIYKLIFNYGFFSNYKYLALVFFLFIAFLGLVFSIFYCIKNSNFLIYFSTTLCIFSFIDIVFQEYFDPLIFFFFFIFGNFFKKTEIKKVGISYLIFYFLLIMSTLIHRNYILIHQFT